MSSVVRMLTLCTSFLVLNADDRPNILWIYVEDTSPYFGCYGDELNKGYTPVVDSLAAKGVLFERCYMPAPVCSATRSAMIFGVMQTTTGTHQHRSSRNFKKGGPVAKNLYQVPGKYKAIPQLMMEAGYHTFNNGKDDYNFTYDRAKLYSSGQPKGYKYPNNGSKVLKGKGSWNDRSEKSPPWFGQIQLKGGKGGSKRLPKEHVLKHGDSPLPPYFPDTDIFNVSWTHHWNTCRQTDLDVAKIIDSLKADGEFENTIIFFFSDHGDNFSLRHKQFCYEGGVHVPLIIYGDHPSIVKGAVRPEIMTALDIGATTLGLANLELPEYLDGQDLFDKNYQKQKYVISARDRCDFTIDRIRTVRSESYRYIKNFKTDRPLLQAQYRDGQATMKELKRLHADGKLDAKVGEMFFGKRPPEELYDMANDPHQMNNLASSSRYESVLIKHRKVLEDWIIETDDKGQYPESDAEMLTQLQFWKQKCVNPEYDKYKVMLSKGVSK